MIRPRFLAVVVSLLVAIIGAQSNALAQSSPAAAATSKPSQSQPAGETETPAVDLSSMLKETQQMDSRNGKLGVFWWVPAEYFEQSAINSGMSPGQARRSFAPMHAYTMFVVAVGSVGFGNIDWLPEDKVRAAIALRDQNGNTYKPLDKVSNDAQAFADLMKPVLKNMLRPTGEGLRFVFFANKDSLGREFTNPTQRSEFTLVVSGLIVQGATSNYTWRLPLTSLTPPRYCPIGKERLEASWKFCPWHGNKLEDVPNPPPQPAEK